MHLTTSSRTPADLDMRIAPNALDQPDLLGLQRPVGRSVIVLGQLGLGCGTRIHAQRRPPVQDRLQFAWRFTLTPVILCPHSTGRAKRDTDYSYAGDENCHLGSPMLL